MAHASEFLENTEVQPERILDGMLLHQLHNLATEGFTLKMRSLKDACRLHLGLELDKNKDIRTTFDQFIGKPIEEIPAEWLDYAASDITATFKLVEYLYKKCKEIDASQLLSHHIQLLGSVALNNIYKNGVEFDLDKRNEFLERKLKELEKPRLALASWGWVRGAKGVDSSYNAIIERLGFKLPMTTKGFSQAAEDLAPFMGNHFIDNFVKYSDLEKEISFVSEIQSTRVHPQYTYLVNTGRTSCEKPNIQQLPRSGEVRSMYKAAPGCLLLITDYSTLELCTLAQICKYTYGFSRMGDLINEGKDLHKYLASIMCGVPESEVTKEQRQGAKAVNFGRPGGLGDAAFIQYAQATYGVTFSEEEALKAKEAWLTAFPEMRAYLKDIKGYCKTLTGRIRAKCGFTNEKNNSFQGLAADGAKMALYTLYREGFKTVMFVHDEIVTEVPASRAAELLAIQERIMIDCMRQVTPDVTIRVESQISERYTK